MPLSRSTGQIFWRTKVTHMPTDNYEIVGSYNKDRIPNIDAERSINLFEYFDPKAKKPKVLLPTSGLQNTGYDFGTDGAFRAQYNFRGTAYHVVKDRVYRQLPNSDPVQIGTLTTVTGYVGISANNATVPEIIFVDGQKGWYYKNDASIPLTQITDINFPGQPIDVTFLDGFFVVANGNSNLFFLSQINKAALWAPLQQGQINSHPGNIVACRTLHRFLFLFSENYVEVWQNQGIGSNLPFRRNNSYLIEVGTPAIGSVTVGFDMLFFLSQDNDGLGSIIKVTGTNAIPVSNIPLDFEMAQFIQDPAVGVADARGILTNENGLIFFRLNFTKANKTYVYNATLSTPQQPLWHEEQTLPGNRHPGQTHLFFDGQNHYGAWDRPVMYHVDDSFLSNDGEAIPRIRIAMPTCPPGYQRIRIDRFHLDLRQGDITQNIHSVEVNLLTEDGLDILTESGIPIIADIIIPPFVDASIQPVVFLSISKDGGVSYGNELRANMGKIGERTFRTVWRKLGTTKRGQAFVPRIKFFHQTPFYILGAAWAYEILPE